MKKANFTISQLLYLLLALALFIGFIIILVKANSTNNGVLDLLGTWLG